MLGCVRFVILISSFVIFLIPEQPGRRNGAAPALSRRLHREALADAADPVARVGELLLLPKEGG